MRPSRGVLAADESGSTLRECGTRQMAGGYADADFRRFAQYFFIRRLTSAFCAADILRRPRRLPVRIVVPSSV
jgi:hypothetical protein